MDVAVEEGERFEACVPGFLEGFETPLVEFGASDGEVFEGGVAEDVDVFLEVPVSVVFALVEEGACGWV